MPLRASPLFVRLGVLALLSGCVTVPPVKARLDPAAQQARLTALDRYALSGRVRVTAPLAPGQDFVAPIQWERRNATTRVKLSGPLGVGGLQLTRTPQGLRLTTSRGLELQGEEAEAALASELGFAPPFEALEYWLRGLPAPAVEVAAQSQDASGRLLQLEQQGWQIHYARYGAVATRDGDLQLPLQIHAIRGDVRLRLIIDRWRFK